MLYVTGNGKGSLQVKALRTVVSPREIAGLCGPPFTDVDVFVAGDEMGLKGAYNRYGRREARLIVAKLMVRACDPVVPASDPDLVERLLEAYRRLADKHEDEVAHPVASP